MTAEPNSKLTKQDKETLDRTATFAAQSVNRLRRIEEDLAWACETLDLIVRQAKLELPLESYREYRTRMESEPHEP